MHLRDAGISSLDQVLLHNLTKFIPALFKLKLILIELTRQSRSLAEKMSFFPSLFHKLATNNHNASQD